MKEWIRKILFIILLGILVFSLNKIIYISNKNHNEDNEFKSIAEKVVKVEESKSDSKNEEDTKEVIKDTQNDKGERVRSSEILSQYKELYNENSDLFGWIKIDDTTIDYPVMYTPNDPEYYLHRSFSKKNTYSGCIFLDANCEEYSNNYLIHGHHMKNGTMFASLLKYKDEQYYKDHPIIKFDTIHEENEYEIIAAFESKVYKIDDKAFKYYNHTSLDSEEEFNAFINGINELKLYDTGIKVEYGDEFITLSTCAYHTEDGRFVVVGVRKKD